MARTRSTLLTLALAALACGAAAPAASAQLGSYYDHYVVAPLDDGLYLQSNLAMNQIDTTSSPEAFIWRFTARVRSACGAGYEVVGDSGKVSSPVFRAAAPSQPFVIGPLTADATFTGSLYSDACGHMVPYSFTAHVDVSTAQDDEIDIGTCRLGGLLTGHTIDRSRFQHSHGSNLAGTTTFAWLTSPGGSPAVATVLPVDTARIGHRMGLCD